MLCTASPSLARPKAEMGGATSANTAFAAPVAIRSLRQTLRSVTAAAEDQRGSRRALTSGSQTPGPLGAMPFCALVFAPEGEERQKTGCHFPPKYPCCLRDKVQGHRRSGRPI